MKSGLNQFFTCLLIYIFGSNSSQAWTRYPLYENSWYDYRVPQVQYPNKSPFSNNLGNPEEYRRHVFEICRYTFSGAWNLITAERMRFFELNRSLKDRWYYCGLPFDVKPLYREYGEAAVIFYGPGRRHPEQASNAAMISAYFSQKQAQQQSTLLSPRILGSFPGGRVEEYWQNGRTYKNSEMPIHANVIVSKLAYIHGLNPPAPRSTDQFWHEIATLLASSRSASISKRVRTHLPPQQSILKEILQVNLEAEAIWLRNYMEDLRAPIVFSHGSLREEEIFYRKYGKEDNKITFLDLGWGRYLYRSYDLADYFIEFGIKYDKRLSYPHFAITGDYPDPNRVKQLIDLYLRSMTTMEREWPAANNTVEGLHEEILRSTLLSHFYYGVQALFSSFYDFGKVFGYPEYAKARLHIYFRLKKTLIETHRMNIPLYATVTHYGDLIDRGYPGAHVLNLNDKLLLDPFFSSSTSITGYIHSENMNTFEKQKEMCNNLCFNILTKNDELNKANDVLLNSNTNYYSQNRYFQKLDQMNIDLNANFGLNNNKREMQIKFTENDLLGALNGKIMNDLLVVNQNTHQIHKQLYDGQQQQLKKVVQQISSQNHNLQKQQIQHIHQLNPSPQTLQLRTIGHIQHHKHVNQAIPQIFKLNNQLLQQNHVHSVAHIHQAIGSSLNYGEKQQLIQVHHVAPIPQIISSSVNLQEKQQVHQVHNMVPIQQASSSSANYGVKQQVYQTHNVPPIPQAISSSINFQEKQQVHQVHNVVPIPQASSSSINLQEKQQVHQVHNVVPIPQASSSSINLQEKQQVHQVHNVVPIPQASSSSINLQEKQQVHNVVPIPQASSSSINLQEKQQVHQAHNVAPIPQIIGSSISYDEKQQVIQAHNAAPIPQTIVSSINLQEKQQFHQVHNVLPIPQTSSSSENYGVKQQVYQNHNVAPISQAISSSIDLQEKQQLHQAHNVAPIQQTIGSSVNYGEKQQVIQAHNLAPIPQTISSSINLQEKQQVYQNHNVAPIPQAISSSVNYGERQQVIQAHNVAPIPQAIGSSINYGERQQVIQAHNVAPIPQAIGSSINYGERQQVIQAHNVAPIPQAIGSSINYGERQQVIQAHNVAPIPQAIGSSINYGERQQVIQAHNVAPIPQAIGSSINYGERQQVIQAHNVAPIPQAIGSSINYGERQQVIQAHNVAPIPQTINSSINLQEKQQLYQVHNVAPIPQSISSSINYREKQQHIHNYLPIPQTLSSNSHIQEQQQNHNLHNVAAIPQSIISTQHLLQHQQQLHKEIQSKSNYKELGEIANSQINVHSKASTKNAFEGVINDEDQILIDPDYDALYRGKAIAKKRKFADRPAYEVV